MSSRDAAVGEPAAAALAALEAHDVDALRDALERAPEVVATRVGVNANHLLDMATATCDERTVALLLAHGADPSAANVHGWTAPTRPPTSGSRRSRG